MQNEKRLAIIVTSSGKYIGAFSDGEYAPAICVAEEYGRLLQDKGAIGEHDIFILTEPEEEVLKQALDGALPF